MSVNPFCCVLPISLLDLLLMQQQPAARKRLVIEGSAGEVLWDVAIHQPDAGAAHLGIGIAQVGLALAQRLYLGAGQRHSGFHLFEQVIVVGGGAILGNDLRARGIFFVGFLSQV